MTVAIGHNHGPEVRRLLQLAAGLHGERLMMAKQCAERLIHVTRLDRLFHLVNAQPEGRQLIRIHLHAHRVRL